MTSVHSFILIGASLRVTGFTYSFFTLRCTACMHAVSYKGVNCESSFAVKMCQNVDVQKFRCRLSEHGC
jgi:hypothetical protein